MVKICNISTSTGEWRFENWSKTVAANEYWADDELCDAVVHEIIAHPCIFSLHLFFNELQE